MGWLEMAIIGMGIIGFAIVYIEVCVWVIEGTTGFKRIWGLKIIPLLINDLKTYKDLRMALYCLVLLIILVALTCTGILGSPFASGFWWMN